MDDKAFERNAVPNLLRAHRESRPQNTVRGPSPAAAIGATGCEALLPLRLSAAQCDALEARHQSLARSLAVALVPLVRGLIEIRVTRVAAESFREFVGAVGSTACVAVFNAPPLGEKILLEIHPSIAYPLLDRMLGGGREQPMLTNRPLTAIEQRLMARIAGVFGDELGRAWEPILPFAASVERVEADPRALRDLSGPAQVVAIGFEFALGQARGQVKLCLPQACVDAFARQGAAGHDANFSSTLPGGQAGPMVELVVRLGETKAGIDDLAGLEPGDIIATDTPMGGLLEVSVGGTTRFRGRPGAFQGRKAIHIESLGERTLPPDGAASEAASVADQQPAVHPKARRHPPHKTG